MTATPNEASPTPGRAQKIVSALQGIELPPQLTGIIITIAGRTVGSALVAWLAGLGLQSGYHVSLPFLGTWAALYAAYTGLGHLAHAMSSGFHLSKVEAVPLLKQAEHDAFATIIAKLDAAGK
jgi:hypothetical protein